VRREAAIVLGRSERPEVGSALVAALEDPYWQVIKEAAAGIAQLRVCAPKPLLGLLGHAHPDIRRTAAAALGAIGAVEAAEPLAALNTDTDIEVRKAASHALDQIALAGRPLS
jgi:HEAT repeat protein